MWTVYLIVIILNIQQIFFSGLTSSWWEYFLILLQRSKLCLGFSNLSICSIGDGLWGKDHYNMLHWQLYRKYFFFPTGTELCSSFTHMMLFCLKPSWVTSYLVSKFLHEKQCFNKGRYLAQVIWEVNCKPEIQTESSIHLTTPTQQHSAQQPIY